MRTEVTDQFLEETIEDFHKRLAQKIEKKGNLSFSSTWEIYGKLSEENYEVLKELHKKDDDKFCEELLDVAITAIYGIASIRALRSSND